MSIEPNPARRPGRPRKWDSNAARSRDYRRRRSAHLAQPLLLLARATDLERELRALRSELDRTRRALVRTERQLADIREKHTSERRQRIELRDQLRRANRELAFKFDRCRRLHIPRPERFYPTDDELPAIRTWDFDDDD